MKFLNGVEPSIRIPTAPSGQWQLPANYNSSSTGTGTAAAGLVFFSPFDVWTIKSFDQMGVSTTVGQVTGTTTTYLGWYPDDGTGGMPNMASGPLFSGTIVLTGTGNKTVSLSITSQNPGRYWGAFLHVVSVAPGTTATYNSLGSCVALWSASATVIGVSSKALVSAAGQTALPTTQISLSPHTGTVCPVIAVRAV